MAIDSEWKKCSSCKAPINYGTKYFVCSVSTCNSKRTGYVFCSIGCFDQHIPMARHKSAGAEELRAPDKPENLMEPGEPRRKRIIPSQKKLSEPSHKQKSKGGEALIIASRLKDFVNSQSEYNTSASVIDALSDHVRHVVMQAIDNAREDGRKTVMEQDLRFLDKLNLNI